VSVIDAHHYLQQSHMNEILVKQSSTVRDLNVYSFYLFKKMYDIISILYVCYFDDFLKCHFNLVIKTLHLLKFKYFTNLQRFKNKKNFIV